MSPSHLTAARLRDLEARLTNRDLTILHRVAVLRFVSGAQLTRLYFTDSDSAAATARAARRALLRLTRLSALERLPRVVGGVRAGSAGFIYRLGVVGQRLAITRGWHSNRRTRRSATVPGTMFLHHCLEVAELHVRLIEAERSGRFELLELSAEPTCWRTYGGFGAGGFILKPDSYVRLGVGEFEDSYFIEVDRATEGSRAISRQLERYVAYATSGMEQATRGVFPKTLWLAPSPERVAVIAACIGRVRPESRELFAVALFADAVSVVSDTAGEISGDDTRQRPGSTVYL